MTGCFLDSLVEMEKDLKRSLNWRPLIWVQPELELVLHTGASSCDRARPPGSRWRDRRVRPAAKAPEEPVEAWKAARAERQEGASSWGVEWRSLGCGRCCWELGRPLLLVESGTAVGRQRGTLTVEPCEREAAGGILGRSAASLGREGSREE